jgi:ribosomal protein L37E
MVKKELIPSVQCKRCMQMHRPDDPMCPHCGFPMPDTRTGQEQSKHNSSGDSDAIKIENQ